MEIIENLVDSSYEEHGDDRHLNSRADLGSFVDGKLDGDLDILVWPWPAAGQVENASIQSIEDKNDVRWIYTAKGTDTLNEVTRDTGIRSFEAVNNRDNWLCLDSLDGSTYDFAEGGVLSHNLAELARQNSLDEIGVEKGIDIEYQRDMGMDIAYNPNLDSRSTMINEEEVDEEEVLDVLETLAEDSRDMLSERGLVISDLHDYSYGGMAQNSYLLGETPWETDKNHMEQVASVYDEEFEDVGLILTFTQTEDESREDWEHYQKLGFAEDYGDFESFRKTNALKLVYAQNPI